MPNYEKSLYQIELICIFHDLTSCQTTCVSIALYHELMCKGDSDALLMAGLKRVNPELSDLLGLWLLCFGSFPKFGIEETGGRLLLLSGVPYLVESVTKPKYIRVQARTSF